MVRETDKAEILLETSIVDPGHLLHAGGGGHPGLPHTECVPRGGAFLRRN